MTPRELLRAGLRQLGLPCEGDAVEGLLLLMEELRKWNRRINLTAIEDEHGIVVKHFLDSLTLLRHLPEEGSLLDIGSGGGFPSLPVKLLRPALSIVSVDSVDKKISFQKHIARLLELEGFLPLHLRAEALPARYPQYFDVVVSRAFSDLPKFTALALPLLKPQGLILAMKGRDGGREAEEGMEELAKLGAVVREVDEFRLPFSGDPRSILTIFRS
ncbi:MAG TPA: 16S rRNA (guanine(527)-N(7))-methyltransferase RsmG [Verrucomicrobiae bacterium]|nr:16S rRNA (guanine(527)-N(7))-methyltransferase RsmG [Verrucomicrobiae bacterium]